MLKRIGFLSTLFLSACGGGNSDNSQVEGPEGILKNIKTSNLDGNGFPWTGVAVGKLKRWDYMIDGLIPVKTNNVALSEQAMDRIEQEIGLVIFDRTSIENTSDNDVSRGIIVSSGTAIGPGGVVNENTCGMVSSGVGTTSFPSNFYNSSGNINTVLYVHLSSSGCTSSLNVAIHEFGHALVMGAHFEGFGIGDAIDNNFWNTLYNIYNNNVGTTESNLVISQIKF